jgi:7,8-dihydroneopterin aldolase/epimerase/oxygenase
MNIQSQRTIYISNLRTEALLGILEHEKLETQSIRIDAAINIGIKNIKPEIDHIDYVVDYREIRSLILHTLKDDRGELLETRTGQIPGVIGVKLRVTKLQIYSDCEVAIELTIGVNGMSENEEWIQPAV